MIKAAEQPSVPIENKYYLKADLRRRYGVSDPTLWRWIKRGLIPQGAYIGAKKCWTPDEVLEADKNLLTTTPSGMEVEHG